MGFDAGRIMPQRLGQLTARRADLVFETSDGYPDRYETIRQIASEMMADGSGDAVEPIRDLFAGQTGYATPKVDVRAAVFRGGRILLVLEREDGAGGAGRIRVRDARGEVAGAL